MAYSSCVRSDTPAGARQRARCTDEGVYSSILAGGAAELLCHNAMPRTPRSAAQRKAQAAPRPRAPAQDLVA